MPNICHHWEVQAAAFFGLLVVAGCGYQAEPRPDRAALSGTVYFRGNILPGGDVTVVSDKDAGLVASAAIKQDGTFRVTDAPNGKVLIAITTDSMRYGRNPESYVEIPVKYRDFAASGLTADVKPSGESTVELRLD